jgi:hypothetical protein
MPAETQPDSRTTSAPPDAGTLVEIRIDVVPASARLTWDAAPIDRDVPLRVSRDDAEHLLRASASGYRSQELRVAPSTDLLVPIRLARAGRPPRTPVTSLPEWRP